MPPHFLGITRMVFNFADSHIHSYLYHSTAGDICTLVSITMTLFHPLHPLHNLSTVSPQLYTLSSLQEAPPSHSSLIYHLPLPSHPLKWGSSQMIMMGLIALLSS